MQEMIKEHDRDVRLVRTHISAILEQDHETGHYPNLERGEVYLSRFSLVHM